jgi:hypothetical protein
LHEENNPIEQTQALIEESKQIQPENDFLQNRILQLEKEIHDLQTQQSKGKIFIHIGHHGIIQKLKRTEINSISITCSSVEQPSKKQIIF